MSKYRFTTCVQCNESEGKTLTTTSDPFLDRQGEFEVVRCKGCGLVRTRNLPQPDELNLFYRDHYGIFHEIQEEIHAPSPKKKNPVKELLKKLGVLALLSQLRIQYDKYAISSVAPEGKILEVGCGIGKIIRPLKEMGAEVVGVEPGPSLVEQAKKAGLEVYCNLFEDFSWEGEKFDQILFSFTLEHIENPKEALEKARSLLKPDGKLYILCPNFNSIERFLFGNNWFCWHLPYHKYYFSQDSLGQLLNNTGFTVTKSKTDFRMDAVIQSMRIAWYHIIKRQKPSFPTNPHYFVMMFSAIFFLPFKFFGMGNLLHVVAKPTESKNS